MPEQSNDYRVVVFGAGGVGKSSLVTRFIRGMCPNHSYLVFVYRFDNFFCHFMQIL